MHPYNPRLVKNAQKLRREMTPQERHLWYDFLRNYPVRFRRQVPTGEYILDFYCSKARLAIELDGTQHYEADAVQYDLKRTQDLKELGVIVQRYDNIQIERNFSIVCEEINRLVTLLLSEAKPGND